MMQFRKGALIALVTTSMAAGAIGAWVFVPGSGGAATTGTTTPSANNGSGSSGTFHSNEDPAHEKAESPQREAEENSGQFHPWGPGGSNEDPQHEAQESPEREAQENAGANGGSGAQGGSGSGGSTTPPNVNG